MLKSRFDTDKLSVKLGTFFSGFSLSPNSWTLMSLVPAVFGFLSIYSDDLFTALILFALAGGIDAIDGAVARVTGTATPRGAFLDGVVDRYVEILIYSGLLIYILPLEDILYLPNPVWVSLLIFGALMPSFVTAYADHRNVVTQKEDHKKMGGLLERFERLLLIYVGMFLGLFNLSYLIYFIALVAVLPNITAFQRILFVLNYKIEVPE